MRGTRHVLCLIPLFLVASTAPGQVLLSEFWTFDISTTGNDVFWKSPTALDPQADVYGVSWELTLVEVTLKPPILPPFTVDVTNEIPPEYRSGYGEAPGPAPIVVFDEHFAFPPPPDPPGFEGDLEMGLDAQGFGYVNLTNVKLGTIIYQGIPMEVRKVRMAGEVTADAYYVGDMNCDGEVNFADINPFVLALSGQQGYEAQYPDCRWLNADCDGDGAVTFADINPFVLLLSGEREPLASTGEHRSQ